MYKNFIPYEITNEKKKYETKSNKRIFILFLILNILTMPFTIEKLKDLKKGEKLQSTENIDVEVDKGEELNFWIEFLKENKAFGSIENNSGEIIGEKIDERELLNRDINVGALEVVDKKIKLKVNK